MKHRADEYDVIVIGAGHAGCEAALASARLGRKVLVMAINIDKIAHMPCNPAIGGIGKGQLVREIDALGGQMGRTIDRALVQIKVLNSSKGPAVQTLRAQADKRFYSLLMKTELLKQEGLELKQEEAAEISSAGKDKIAVGTTTGRKFTAKAVVITTGTFLRGQTTIGRRSFSGGRAGEAASTELSASLAKLGIELGRFQSATPPRISRRSCNPKRMTGQPGDEEPLGFSFSSKKKTRKRQRLCWLTHTNKKTHAIIEENIHLSPIKSGSVSAKGPRYCPSIDRKVINFPDRGEHPVFVEPEGWQNEEMYLQGLTTSMPVEIQEKIIQSVPGLENAEIIRPGYAVAYDFVKSGQLSSGLETLAAPGVFTAGQINGTSGYEEAAAQGLVAGINAARYCRGEEPIVLGRSRAYIGVLIDDLVTKEIDEPYRIFTSRAEHRLILRSDNADLRLSGIGREIGLVPARLAGKTLAKKEAIDSCLKKLAAAKIAPHRQAKLGLGPNQTGRTHRAIDLLKRPEIGIEDLVEAAALGGIDREARREAEIEVKYEGYIRRQTERINTQRKMEETTIPKIDYMKIDALSIEARTKLDSVRPRSLGQAARIAGVSPADISVLMIWLERLKRTI